MHVTSIFTTFIGIVKKELKKMLKKRNFLLCYVLIKYVTCDSSSPYEDIPSEHFARKFIFRQ